jgi:NAD kinase
MIAKYGGNYRVVEIPFMSDLDLSEAVKEVELIVVAGGDGTISSVLKELKFEHPPIAILPLGTGNNLARELGMSTFWRDRDLQESFMELPSLNTLELQLWGIFCTASGKQIGTF